jgi:cAMP and cAMP-inhibited cGMP 3',5'-cyclic phosphodiesterase 10
LHVSITRQIYEEFFEQGDEEKKCGLTPIEMMDREKAVIPRCQIDFIDHVGLPAYTSLAHVLPQIRPLLDNLLRNRERWAGVLEGKHVNENLTPVYIPSI